MTKLGSRKLHICSKVTKMGSIIVHRIDYNGVGVLRGQWHIPSKSRNIQSDALIKTDSELKVAGTLWDFLGR